MEVEPEQKPNAELQQFIDQVIVPQLVESITKELGHLYSAEASQYDAEEPLQNAA